MGYGILSCSGLAAIWWSTGSTRLAEWTWMSVSLRPALSLRLGAPRPVGGPAAIGSRIAPSFRVPRDCRLAYHRWLPASRWRPAVFVVLIDYAVQNRVFLLVLARSSTVDASAHSGTP